MDVLYKMFSLMMKKYYQDFSWEKIVKYNLELRYNSIIESLKKMIADKDLELESCFRQQSIQTEKISADKDELIKPFVIENNKLNKRIDAQAVEIIKLQKQIRIQNEYIAELQKPELPPIEENVDLELLQRKRYLFVGRADEALPELKHNFPNSIFMNSENINIANLKVDGIIYLIKWMSHGMFYKVKSEKSLVGIPVAMCNTKNINRIYWDMSKIGENE